MQVNEIIKRGGVVGLTFVGSFLNKSGVASFEDVYRHIAYFLENFDENHICFGTDFYGTKNTPIGLDGYADMEKLFLFLRGKGLTEKTLNKIF